MNKFKETALNPKKYSHSPLCACCLSYLALAKCSLLHLCKNGALDMRKVSKAMRKWAVSIEFCSH